MAGETVACGVSSCSGGGDEAATPSGAFSPTTRVKFLCSYGGKILPRQPDGQLKYVGGETRVIGVPRDINFSALMKKLTSEVEGDVVLKYQLIPEDLDVLVSVRNDEDLKHMLEEYDRHENGGAAKFRAFLFPSTPVVLENQNAPTDPQAVENRYIYAINNMVSATPNPTLPSVTANRPTFSISANSSPTGNSPDSNTDPVMLHEQPFKSGYHNSRLGMHRVHSSPSVYNLGSHHNHGNHHLYHHQHQHYQQHYPTGSQSYRPPHEHHRMTPHSLSGHPSFGRAPLLPLNQYYSNAHNWNSSGHNMGNKYGHYDEPYAYGCRTTERYDSLPTSPRNRMLE